MTRWQRYLGPGILVLAVIVLFNRLFLGEVIFWGTPTLQFYPWNEFAFSQLRAGQMPLWNSLVGSGAPLLANYQTAVFYPPSWLQLVIPSRYALGILGCLHIVWAGFGMAAFLRRLEVDALGQGVGALAFALSGFVIGRFGFFSITFAVAWLPWLFWAVETLLMSEMRLMKATALLAAVVAALLLAGHAQSAFYSLVLAAFYAVYRVLSDSSLRLRWWVLGAVLGAVMLGAGVAAVQLLPTYELTRFSQRASGIAYLEALSYSFWPWHFLTFLLPGMFGSPANDTYWGYGAYWEDAVFVGVLTLSLALRAVVGWWRTRGAGEQSHGLSVVPFFAVSTIPVMLFALGWNTPVFIWLFENVPTFDMFNGPARWTLLVVFALSVLGGIGTSGWKARNREIKQAGYVLTVGLALVLAGVGAQVGLGDTIDASFIAATARLGVTLAAIALLVFLLRRVDRGAFPRPAWHVLVLALLAGELVSAHWGLNPSVPAHLLDERSQIADLVPAGTRSVFLPSDEESAKFDIFFSFAGFRADDADLWSTLRASHLPNIAMFDGVPSASVDDPLRIGEYVQLLTAIDSLPPEPQVEALRRMNVSTLLSPSPRSDLEIIDRVGGIYVHRIPDPWRRISLADCTPVGQTLTCQPIDTPDIITDTPNRIEVGVSTQSPAYILLLDTYYPGWVAEVDGDPVAIQRAFVTYRAVSVPAGRHHVAFTYKPASFRRGLLVTCIGLFMTASLLIFDAVQARLK